MSPLRMPTNVLPPPPGLGAAPALPPPMPSPAGPATPVLPEMTSYSGPPPSPGMMGGMPPGMGPGVPPPFDPAMLPQGARMYEDGSVSLSPEAAMAIFANQTGGGGPMPPGAPPLPPGMEAAAPMLGGGPIPFSGPAPAPAAPPPFMGGQMPGQAPVPPSDPAGALMFQMQGGGGPAEPPRAPLSAPPNATPPPRSEWPLFLRTGDASGPSKAPIDKLRNRGAQPTRRGR
jgi:hypothetical protein